MPSGTVLAGSCCYFVREAVIADFPLRGIDFLEHSRKEAIGTLLAGKGAKVAGLIHECSSRDGGREMRFQGARHLTAARALQGGILFESLCDDIFVFFPLQ